MAADLDTILKKYRQGKREELIPLLQELQVEQGYLSEETILKYAMEHRAL
jgi:NADH:ubiquinone oxidoreductase subunit E